ncbi:MAG: DNA gyrase C-terminal beta-propeller domain-containing protein, partial [Ectothiorhodospira sp.]
DRYVLATDHGHGFIVRLEDMITRNRTGKAVLTVPAGAGVLHPLRIHDMEGQYLAAATSTGYLLILPLSDLPQMARGKGNKILHIPPARLKAGEESLVALVLVDADAPLTVVAGKKTKTMKPEEWRDYLGERGRRGQRLPRGYQKVDRLQSG